MYKLSIAVTLMLASVLTGCASVPMAPIDQDTRAKQFDVSPGKSNIYLYRDEEFGAAISMPVALDGRVAGKTAANTYFLWTVEPGSHEISSLTENTATISIDAEAGRNYFIWQEVKMGMWMARSALHEVTPEVGMAGVMECKLIESGL
jgi:hypothetical protein